MYVLDVLFRILFFLYRIAATALDHIFNAKNQIFRKNFVLKNPKNFVLKTQKNCVQKFVFLTPIEIIIKISKKPRINFLHTFFQKFFQNGV